MPRITQTPDMKGYNLGGNFTFTAKRIERLGATEYTLVTIAVDNTGSVRGFEQDLTKALETAIESCKRSPRSDNLLLRVLYFSTVYPKGLLEVHGFKPLAEIDPKSYPAMTPGGSTPLTDACYSSIEAMNAYGKDLALQEYLANGIVFVITDGDDNASVATKTMVADAQKSAVSGEHLESLVSVLVGINAGYFQQTLEDFVRNTGIDKYIDVGDATKQKLAKLAEFVSRSISSQSQSLGTGGPSQNIAATI